jgi:hypothetical protein
MDTTSPRREPSWSNASNDPCTLVGLSEIMLEATKEGASLETKVTEQMMMSRRNFLKLGLAGISAVVLLLATGCVGEEDDEDDDDGSRRRRRRRR